MKNISISKLIEKTFKLITCTLIGLSFFDEVLQNSALPIAGLTFKYIFTQVSTQCHHPPNK